MKRLTQERQDYLREIWPKDNNLIVELFDELDDLRIQNEDLMNRLKKFTILGTTGCMKCDGGRVSMFTYGDCICFGCENEDDLKSAISNQSHPQTLFPCCTSDKEPERSNQEEQGEGSENEALCDRHGIGCLGCQFCKPDIDAP